MLREEKYFFLLFYGFFKPTNFTNHYFSVISCPEAEENLLMPVTTSFLNKSNKEKEGKVIGRKMATEIINML